MLGCIFSYPWFLAFLGSFSISWGLATPSVIDFLFRLLYDIFISACDENRWILGDCEWVFHLFLISPRLLYVHLEVSVEGVTCDTPVIFYNICMPIIFEGCLQFNVSIIRSYILQNLISYISNNFEYITVGLLSF